MTILFLLRVQIKKTLFTVMFIGNSCNKKTTEDIIPCGFKFIY